MGMRHVIERELDCYFVSRMDVKITLALLRLHVKIERPFLLPASCYAFVN